MHRSYTLNCSYIPVLSQKLHVLVLTEPQDAWVVHDNHTLTTTDKTKIEQSEQLTDKHMQMAQYLAKKQFTLVGGL